MTIDRKYLKRFKSPARRNAFIKRRIKGSPPAHLKDMEFTDTLGDPQKSYWYARFQIEEFALKQEQYQNRYNAISKARWVLDSTDWEKACPSYGDVAYHCEICNLRESLKRYERTRVNIETIVSSFIRDLDLNLKRNDRRQNYEVAFKHHFGAPPVLKSYDEDWYFSCPSLHHRPRPVS